MSTERTFAVIVGSGFAGLGAAIALKRAGLHDFVVLEKAGAVGGTWRENTYPGCACDVPSHVYSFSFFPNPRWSETYATQPEIRDYLERATDRFDVRRHLRFGAEVVTATLDEERGTWTVTTKGGDTFVADVVVAGLGPLHRWSFPKVPGLERFRGKAFHSAGWDHAFDPSGKRIAAIGTGASAIQFIPELAKVAARLHVFQRTPAWVLPREERTYGELEKLALERVPGLRLLLRGEQFLRAEMRSFAFVNEPRLLALAERMAKRNIAKAISDPELRAKLTPTYRMGCKRILMSNTYYPALARPNVELVAGALERVTESGVVGPDGKERPVDAVVFGTGFDVHDYLGGLHVFGRGGRELGAEWSARGAEAYLGTVVSGFPNLFTLVGPNTGLGHNSIIFMIESQVRLVMKCVERIRRAPGTLLEVREDVQRAFNERIQRKLSETVWQSGCRSWYLDARGKNTTIWPGFCVGFRWETSRFSERDFRIEVAPRARGPVETRGEPSSVPAG
jgi:cation diffusion facilitator CzcD-associated flavoprotein CzcO